MKNILTLLILLVLSTAAASTPPCDPPINDDPCINSVNPPLDLTEVGSHTGTTCCARGFNDPDNGEDQQNLDCNTITDDNAVWYTYTIGTDDAGVDVSVTADGITGNTAIEVYWGQPDAGCTQGLFMETVISNCGPLPFSGKIGNCPPADGDVLFVKVASTDADCGAFSIVLTAGECSQGEGYNTCADAALGEPIEPITNEMFEIDYYCIQGCLDYACPEEDALGGCGAFTESPTVWFQVTADDLASQMFTTVETGGVWTPVWSVYSGPDCDNLTLVNFGGTPPCSDGDDTTELHQTSVFDDEENYWIAITADSNNLPPGGIEDGSFELCVATTINGLICLGELEGGDCGDESLVIEVIERENEDQPLEGPFCPGEEITVSISFLYDATESGADWLIGFVPTFGPGWDMEGFDFEANAPTGDGETGEWFTEDGPCAPIIQESNPILCTFENEDGSLEICNLLCDPCSECEDGTMQEGDPLPSGYFWISSGGNAGCENDCSPGEGWGIGSPTSQIEWTFTLQVKEFDTQDECLENNSLAISFQSFSDGVAGCWEDPVGECILDRAMFGPPWMIDCISPPKVIAEDQNICTGEEAGLMVETIDGTVYPIAVTFVDNPNVTGEGTGSNGTLFDEGFGTINDVLVNTTNTLQEVVYSAAIIAPDDFSCDGVPQEYVVTVYPEPAVQFSPNPAGTCQGECLDISPQVGGFGGHSFIWSQGSTSPSIEVCPEFYTTYFVTVTNAGGCTASAFVDVDVKDSLVFDLGPDLLLVQDGIFDGLNPQYIVSVDVMQGSSPIDWVYTPEAGLIGTELLPGAWAINEEASIDSIGDGLDLCFTGTDLHGCSSEKCIQVFLYQKLTIIPDTLACLEEEFCFDIASETELSVPCPDIQIRSCAGDILWEVTGSTTGYFDPPCFDLTSVNCFTVISSCGDTVTFTQEINTPPDVDLVDVTSCIGDSVLISSPVVGQAVWTDIDGTIVSDSTDFWSTATTSTTYFLALTSGTCTALDTVMHTVETPSVSGTAYIDANENGIFDTGELSLANTLITDPTTGASVLTSADGSYSLILTSTMDQSIVATQSAGSWVQSTITVTDLSFTEDCSAVTEIGFVLDLQPPTVEVSITSYLTRCSQEVRFYISYVNTGSEPVSGTLSLAYDPLTSFVLATNGGTDDGISVSWEIDGLDPHQSQTQQITLLMPDAQLPFPIMDFVGTFTAPDGTETAPVVYSSLLRCSYDPNDKAVHPDRLGDENLTLFDESLQYTIRFQNNGNDTAFAVTIVDELDPIIIPTSVRVLSSSHEVETHIQGQLLTFTFPGIELVDSMTNYAGSQGYVSFACQTVDEVDELTVVENTADIIFDTNPPIVTNTVTNTMVSTLCSDVVVSDTVTICAGESYLNYTEAGSYTETIPLDTLGCEYTYMLELIVVAPENEPVDIGLCPGDIALINGVTYSEPGTYQDSLLSDGCVVTIYEIEISAIEPVSVTLDTTICPGEAVYGFEETGTYSLTLPNSEGCDTLVDLSLTLLSADDPLCAVSVQDPSHTALRLFPNPVTDLLKIEADRVMAEVSLYQPDGVLLVEEESVLSTELSISLEDHPSGVYILVVRYDDGSVIARRLVKM